MEGIVVSGATVQKDLAKISLIGVDNKPGTAARVFAHMAGSQVSVNDIIQTEINAEKANLSFTIARGDLSAAKKAIEVLRQSIPCDDVFVRDDVAQVSVVGVGMRSHCGVAQTMFSALSEQKVNIDSITTSEIRISCLLDLPDAEKALVAVCDAFKLDKPAPER